MEVILTDQHLNLVEEGIDVAIRTGRLPIPVSSRASWRCRGGPSSPAPPISIAPACRRRRPISPRHDCIIFGPDGRRRDLADRGVRRQAETVTVRGRIAVNTVRFAIRAAIAGLGIALVPSPLVAREMRAEQLRTVLDAFEPPHGGLYARLPEQPPHAGGGQGVRRFRRRTAGMARR